MTRERFAAVAAAVMAPEWARLGASHTYLPQEEKPQEEKPQRERDRAAQRARKRRQGERRRR